MKLCFDIDSVWNAYVLRGNIFFVQSNTQKNDVGFISLFTVILVTTIIDGVLFSST
jgi:hypothetical protein